MAQIQTLKDRTSGTVIYPETVAKAVYLNDGTNVEAYLEHHSDTSARRQNVHENPVLQRGMMSLNAMPGLIYDGRKFMDWRTQDKGFTIKLYKKQLAKAPGKIVIDLVRAFPAGVFINNFVFTPVFFAYQYKSWENEMGVEINCKYDAPTNTLTVTPEKDLFATVGGTTIVAFVRLKYNRYDYEFLYPRYITTDVSGQIKFANNQTPIQKKHRCDFKIRELIEPSESGGRMYAYGNAEDGSILEIQFRSRRRKTGYMPWGWSSNIDYSSIAPNSTRWRRRKKIPKMGVLRARRLSKSGLRSDWVYYTFWHGGFKKI